MAALDWLKGISDIVSAGANAFSAIGSYSQQKKANELSAKNLQMQKEENDYQHQLQQQIFEREDTGYQRAVADARAAGLSALSVTSPSDSGSVVSTTAPQQELDQSGYSNGMNALNNFSNSLQNIQQLNLNSRIADSQISKTAAETEKTLAEIEDMRLRNPITRNILSQQLQDSLFDYNKKSWLWNNGEKDNFKDIWGINANNNKRNKLAYLQDFNDFNYLSRYGLSTQMTAPERLMAMQSMLDFGSPTFDIWKYDSDSNSFYKSGPNFNFKKPGSHLKPGVNQTKDFLSDVLNNNLWQLWLNSVLPSAQKLPFEAIK